MIGGFNAMNNGRSPLPCAGAGWGAFLLAMLVAVALVSA